tara:strand:+ start:60 stop:215 length:156 start_codon:yes stop_codon:yes gene_type:complete
MPRSYEYEVFFRNKGDKEGKLMRNVIIANNLKEVKSILEKDNYVLDGYIRR